MSFTDLLTITSRIKYSTDRRGIGITALRTSNPVMKYTLLKALFSNYYTRIVNKSCILFNKISTTIIVIKVTNFEKKYLS